MRTAVFMSHPIQHFTPLWQELARREGIYLKVFYYSRQAVEQSFDRGFGVKMTWDVDLLAGYEYEFLPRQFPTTDPLDYSETGLNKNIYKSLSQGFDAAYVAGYGYLNNWRVAVVCRKLGIPLLYQSDSSFIAELQKFCLKRVAKRLFVTQFFRYVSAFLSVGNNNRDFYIYYGVPPRKIFFCPIPVDIARFQKGVANASARDFEQLRAKYNIPQNKKIMVFSGKFMPIKRPLDLIKAVKLLKRDDVVCLFIGDGELKPDIEAVKDEQVILTGFVNQRQIPLLLSMGSLCVVPSSRDAHPLAVTESLCLGVPVILSDMCGCYGPDDVLRDGEDGLVYRCGDVQDLANKIEYLLEHKQEYEKMCIRARQLAATQSPQATADSFLRAARSVRS
jgi:glycosyltransferase involved in cell wall biosynthesis